MNISHPLAASGYYEGKWVVGVSLLSEEFDDFFFRSELRLALFHALGLVNWVWY